jgi:hypothetical protein
VQYFEYCTHTLGVDDDLAQVEYTAFSAAASTPMTDRDGRPGSGRIQAGTASGSSGPGIGSTGAGGNVSGVSGESSPGSSGTGSVGSIGG